jgi:2,5-dihydroxypyridine 5,6-dioxygenase
MHEKLDDTILSERFEEVLKYCALKKSETVLIFTDTSFPHPSYPTIALHAARKLGADGYILMAGNSQNLQDRTIHAAWTNADLILGMSFLPGDYSWMYTDLHNDALAAGARVLMVQEPAGVLVRLMPTRETIRRGVEGAKRMQAAASVRVFSSDGTDLVMSKQGRKGSYQCGFVDSPGRWDHWPSAMVYCAPVEDSTSGDLVVRAGDAIIGMGLWQYAQQEICYTFEEGRITSIKGGADAARVRELLQEAGDDGSFRLAHVGWGLDRRADWSHVGMDSESFYGNITVALGRNIFDTPQAHCGLGGKNRGKIHFDMCLLEKSMALDNQIVISEGRFQDEALG